MSTATRPLGARVLDGTQQKVLGVYQARFGSTAPTYVEVGEAIEMSPDVVKYAAGVLLAKGFLRYRTGCGPGSWRALEFRPEGDDGCKNCAACGQKISKIGATQ